MKKRKNPKYIGCFQEGDTWMIWLNREDLMWVGFTTKCNANSVWVDHLWSNADIKDSLVFKAPLEFIE